MLATVNCYSTTVLFLLIHPSFSATVLPRPPSSPNYIQRFDQRLNDRRLYEGRSLRSVLHNSNTERANNDYSLVEIELQSADEMDATSLQNIVHAMMKQSVQVRNDSYPQPEVVPRSIFGVRDVAVTPNFKLDVVNRDKHVLMAPPKLQNLDEKLYYLKNNRPKVYINVRGYSGSFRKDALSKTSSNNYPMEFLRMAPSLVKQIDRKSQYERKIHSPKKFNYRAEANREYQKSPLRNETKKLSRLDIVYGLHDLSTTENSLVTSSELPKQIPTPPSKLSSRTLMVQTTPVQRYALRRTDILPGYSFSDV
ncbi:PREDICTED: uncharacterized protein LOC108577221 [Habropoda laboriosa]|nr:PREDICTED: uncharacterized protein LOC108577221 [Habropoda laboriosa]